MGFELQPPIIWLIVFGIMVVVELVTMGLTTIWFAGGALVSVFASLAGAGTIVQIVLFIIVSVVLLFLIRPYAKKRFNHDRVRTNAQSLIGQVGIVLEPIDNIKSEGRIMIRGQEWAARNVVDTETIAKDTKVRITAISGVKLLVEKEENV